MFLSEIFKRKLVEGGNSELPNLDDPSQPHQAQHIDLTKVNRDDVLPAIDQLLATVNTAFQKFTGKPLWSADVLRDRKHTSGSTFHFLDPKIPSKEFTKYKPSVGDIDTMVDRASKQEIERFLQSIRNKPLGNFKLLNYDEESEEGKAKRLKKGEEDKRAQFITQWEIFAPIQFKGLQIDLELADFEPNPETGEAQPTDWARFSHSSDWADIQNNIKGVFHKWFIQSLTTISSTTKHRVDVLKTKTKIGQAPEVDNDTSFAVASGQGGGMSQKYAPYTDPTTGEKERSGVPLKRYVPPAERTYVKDLDRQFNMLFGRQPTPADLQSYESFIGLINLANQYLTPQQRQAVADDFVKTCFDLDAQMITKNNPEADAKTKMAAIDYMTANLKGINAKGVTANANQMLTAYAKDHYDLQAFKAANPDVRNARAAMRSAQMASQPQQMNEAGEEQPQVKAQLRKNMPHLKDLKPLDFLDLLDELHDGNGRFKLQNIPLNVKVDGFGGRFGKNAEGKPFMGTSNTEPRYKAGFVDYHKQKGTTDPDVLARSQLFDDLFNEMMKAIKLVDSKLGADFLNDKQVTCEVLFLPFATRTPEGKLKFVGIAYDELPKGVQLALVPFRVVQASTGEDIPEAQEIVKQLTSLGQQGSVMFIDNSLTQNDALDVTAIVPPLENIDEFKSVLADAGTKRDRASVELRRSVAAALDPIKVALEKAIINDPNIIGKNILGKDYEGIVINSRLGPIKITSQEQRDVIAAKQAAKASARQERPRDGQKSVAAVAIGSAIGHMGHQQLFSETIKVANETGGDPYFFIGNAEGKDDPIPVTDKLKTWHMLYPQYAKNISTVTMDGGSLLQKVKHELINPLPGKPPRYSTIYIVVGTDRELFAKQTAAALMKAVTKFPGYEHVQVIPKVTERGAESGGTGMSGTALRQALSQDSIKIKNKIIPTKTEEQKFAVWNNAFNSGNFGAKQLPPDWIKHLMDVSKGERFIKKPAPTQKLPKQAKPQVQLPQQTEPQPMGEDWKTKAAGAVLAASSLLGNPAHAGDDNANAGWRNLPDIVAHIKMKVNGKIIEKEINLGTEYQSPMAAKEAVAQWLKEKSVTNYTIDLERVRSKPSVDEYKVIKIGEAWELEMAGAIGLLLENMDHSKDGQAVGELKAALLAKKKTLQNASDDQVYDIIDKIMTRISKAHSMSGQKLHDLWVDQYDQIPDTWIMDENFADGKNPGRKGLSKRMGVNTKASVSSLRKTAKHSSGEKARMAHWLANMKAGRAKAHKK
jgi:hypothetical protein